MEFNKNMAFAKVKPDWNNWGLINLKGDYILDPIYKSIFDWRDGIARLEKKETKIDIERRSWTNHFNGEYGFVNSTGELITDFSFGYANDFFEGLAGVNKNKKWGFINRQGKLVIPHEYDSILNFQDGLCAVEREQKWGVINKNGEWIIKNDYKQISSFSFGLAIATKKEGVFGKVKKFVINTFGQKIVDLPEDLGWFVPVSEELILIGTTSNFPGERYYGFMDLKGNIKIAPIFYTNSDTDFDIGKFKDGKLLVSTKEGKSGYITLQGEFIEFNESEKVPDKNEFTSNKLFDEVLEFSEGFAVARKDSFWGVINKNNEVVIDFIYKRRTVRLKEDRGQFLSGYYPKVSCGLLGIEDEQDDNIYSGYIDTSGKGVIDFKFRIIKPFINQITLANMHSK